MVSWPAAPSVDEVNVSAVPLLLSAAVTPRFAELMAFARPESVLSDESSVMFYKTPLPTWMDIDPLSVSDAFATAPKVPLSGLVLVNPEPMYFKAVGVAAVNAESTVSAPFAPANCEVNVSVDWPWLVVTPAVTPRPAALIAATTPERVLTPLPV